MAARVSKRDYRKRPGLKAAAKQLGCTYQHLRLCVIGQRKSHSLMQRYENLALKMIATNKTQREEPNVRTRQG